MEMEAMKPYLIAIVVQLIYTGMNIVSKAAFDHGINTFVFMFYRTAAASLLLLPVAIILQRKNVRSMSLGVLLKLFFYALIGNTFSLNLYNANMKLTSATVASAASNAMPVFTFCLALLLRMEAVKLRSRSGVAKLAGVALCLAGVFVLAFYVGPALSPVHRQRAFASSSNDNNSVVHPSSRMTWIKGTLLIVLSTVTWALWIVLQNTRMTATSTKKKAYAVAMVFQVILASTTILSKAAFDRGLSTFVFVFYRLAAASLFLLPLAILLARKSAPPLSFRLLGKMFLYALAGNTLSLNLANVSLKYTSTTVASAMCNSIPVITFFLALLMRMEVIDLKRPSGKGKAAGITLCLAGVLMIALYAGSSLSPLNHSHHGVLLAAGHHGDSRQQAPAGHVSKGMWIMGTFLMLLACLAWSLWMVLQGLLLKEYPNKLLATLIQCLFGTVQSCVVAVAIERDPSRWKLGLDLSLLAVAYSGIVGTGVCFYLQTWCVDMKGPVFLAMWYPMSLLLTVLGSSLLGETTHLGSILGGILLVGGLYCVLWGKNKEEIHTTTMPSDDHQEQSSREQGDADAAISCTSTV